MTGSVKTKSLKPSRNFATESIKRKSLKPSRVMIVIKTLYMMDNFSKDKRSIEFEASPNFLFLADLYAKAPKIITGPDIAAWYGFIIPEIIIIIPIQRAMVEPMCFFITDELLYVTFKFNSRGAKTIKRVKSLLGTLRLKEIITSYPCCIV